VTDEADLEAPESQYETVADVPVQVVNTYARLWQLETWLRVLVYVELRALQGDDWSKALTLNPKPFAADKSLTHMPTPEMNALSYAQLSDLLKIISQYWDCFSVYFPPKNLWDAKFEEVKQIRNRVAHFRIGHEDDLMRVKQLLRDLDKGFCRFCTSYNSYSPLLPVENDPVAMHFLPLDPLPWQEFSPNRWMQIGFRDKSLPIGVSVRSQRRPWATTPLEPGKPGHLYDISLFAQDGRVFDLRTLLTRTARLHKHLVHICLDHDNMVRLTIPTVLGSSVVIDVVSKFHEAALANVRRGYGRASAEAVANQFPEYVIGPRNPLSFLDSEMPCSFFAV
jgi:hypothetical protein